ncbi:MAG: hypothetical protein ABSF76_16305, partial [Opitutaceae bacterium]
MDGVKAALRVAIRHTLERHDAALPHGIGGAEPLPGFPVDNLAHAERAARRKLAAEGPRPACGDDKVEGAALLGH